MSLPGESLARTGTASYDATVHPETVPLATALEQSRIRRARQMSVEQRLVMGAGLFDYACQAALAGLRAQWPSASDADLLVRLSERLRRERAREVTPA